MDSKANLIGLLRDYPDMANNGHFIVQAVREGLWPFKDRGVVLELLYDSTYLATKLLIEVRGLPRDPYSFVYEFSAAEYYTLFDPETVLTRDAAEAAFNYFRHIPRVEPEANIQLGDN